MSSSPAAGEEPPPDVDEAPPDDADLEYSDKLVRDTVLAVLPRLTVLDGPAVDDTGDKLPSSASSRLGRREPKLRRCCVVAAAAAWLRPAIEERIQRVALKESRKRTLLTAVRRVPRTDAGCFSGSI